MPSPSAPIGSQPTGDPPPSGGAGEPHFPRNLSPGQNPSRSHSVHFSNSPSPTSSPAPRRTTQSSNDSKSRANQSPTAESSADEITPIVGRERGNGKGRRYDGASPEAGEEVHGANAEGSKRSSASSLTAKRRRKKGGVSRQGENEGIDSPDGREDEGEGIMGRISAWAKNVADKYGSVELDNKGSVARDHLALERTFLAWLRTSLAFASIGIAVTQLFRLNSSINEGRGLEPEPPAHVVHLRQLGKPLGATFLGIAILVLVLGGRRYFESQYWIIRGKFPASRGSIFLLTFIAVALIVTSLVVVCVVDPTIFKKR